MEIDLYKYENEYKSKGYKYIAGGDEAGRGPLAGPVVASAVILPDDFVLEGLDDSKKLSKKKRDLYFDYIKEHALSYEITVIDVDTIDKINIYESSRLAMNKSVDNLSIKPDFILTDAMPLKRDNCLDIIKGDQKSITIAAASVLAKVTRDRLMEELDLIHPQYGFKKHKGYGTKLHLENIKKYGILVGVHRLTYKPVTIEYNKNNINKGE